MYLTESHTHVFNRNTRMHFTESNVYAFNRITRMYLTESHNAESHMHALTESHIRI